MWSYLFLALTVFQITLIVFAVAKKLAAFIVMKLIFLVRNIYIYVYKNDFIYFGINYRVSLEIKM